MNVAGLRKLLSETKPKPASKYRNIRVASFDEAGNPITVDSKKEARRWAELQQLQRAGLISNLQRQISYPLIVNGTKVCVIRPDFQYSDKAGKPVIEDVKSPATRKNPTYRVKKKLFEAINPDLVITEV